MKGPDPIVTSESAYKSTSSLQHSFVLIKLGFQKYMIAKSVWEKYKRIQLNQGEIGA